VFSSKKIIIIEELTCWDPIDLISIQRLFESQEKNDNKNKYLQNQAHTK
jgi:hypothetical protein